MGLPSNKTGTQIAAIVASVFWKDNWPDSENNSAYSTLLLLNATLLLGNEINEDTDDRRGNFRRRESGEPFDNDQNDHVSEGAHEEKQLRHEHENQFDPVSEMDAIESFEEDPQGHVHHSHNNRCFHFERV